MTLPDLAKIGQLVADGGAYEGQQIVPSDWLAQSLHPCVPLNEFTRYGYLWYLSGNEKNPIAIAVGNGGQRLTVEIGVDLVVASFAGRYNDAESWQTPIKVLFDYAVPEAKRLLAE